MSAASLSPLAGRITSEARRARTERENRFAQEQGYSTYAQYRKAINAKRGLSATQAYGHAKPTERTIRELRAAGELPPLHPMEVIAAGVGRKVVDQRPGTAGAKLAGRQANAIRALLEARTSVETRAAERQLRRLRGKKVAGWELETDPDTITVLSQQGLLNGYRPYTDDTSPAWEWAA